MYVLCFVVVVALLIFKVISLEKEINRIDLVLTTLLSSIHFVEIEENEDD